MKPTGVFALLSFAWAIKALPPQPQRTSEIYKWRPGRVDCATMPSADGPDLKQLLDWVGIRDIKYYIPPTRHCYRPLCFSLSTAGVYVLLQLTAVQRQPPNLMMQNKSETVTIRGRYLADAISQVRDNCCVHEGYKDFQKSGTVDFPEMGVRVHVGLTDCLNDNDWIDPLTVKGPNNCLMDAMRGAPVYIPGVNHTDAYGN
ncbi:hypothetical protein MAPG_04927 [Magnaporthiopsis poae ATCC 64411]|uniref:Ecp2 effector protein domain-containing protein n=1 Tax=Magnaporthiopsis poae (strain ATCC 64411 / 73-15) TaxID=644358 RepID=A0A0C4DY18_MAGP6|nr:hypothetical protein MAPG_04927 [Magnaporthiopsis poae ATCC 64411]